MRTTLEISTDSYWAVRGAGLNDGLFRNDGLFQTIVTLPSVLSAVCIAHN